MKKILLIISILCGLCAAIHAQIAPAPLTAAEEQEAKELAARFFNRFQETQDIAPLIEEFFIEDFARRLKFCRATGECGGEDRDFWKEREDFVSFNATETDFLRTYIFSINDIFLTYRSIRYFRVNQKEIDEKDFEYATKNLLKELKLQLGNKSKLIEFGFLGVSRKNVGDDFFYSKFKTLIALRRFLDNYEKYLTALRAVESKSRINYQKANPTVKTSFSSTDFRFHLENNRYGFFDYPNETRTVQVWGESDSVMFIMDLIRENERLKIVAIYPPID